MPDLYQGEIFEDSGSGEPVERFEYRCIGPGPGLDDIEEVAGVDEHIGFCWMISSIALRKLS
jgi:hypothetical protein